MYKYNILGNLCKNCNNGKKCKQHCNKIKTYNYTKNAFVDYMMSINLNEPVFFPTKFFKEFKKFPILKKHTFLLKPNNFGKIGFQVNFGQFINSTLFKEYKDQNAIEGLPSSNIFVAGDNFDGKNLVKNTNIVSNIKGLDVSVSKLDHFSGIRQGPATLHISYVGNIDEMSGVISVSVTNTFGSGSGNEILSYSPDINELNVTAISNSSIKKIQRIQNDVKIVYLPSEIDKLEFYEPDKGNSGVTQRVNVVCEGVNATDNVLKVVLTETFEGIPKTQFSEIANKKIKYASDTDMEIVTQYFKNKGQII
jgi:hypothetical protein